MSTPINSGYSVAYWPPDHPFERDDDALIAAEQEATDAFDCAINQVHECMGKLRVQQGAGDPHGCFKSALAYLSDAVRDLQFGKTKAAEEAAENVRNG